MNPPREAERDFTGNEAKGTMQAAFIRDTISAGTAQKFYDWLGARHDWAEFFESRAKRQALQLLNVMPGQTVLNAGCGTGKDQREVEARVSPGGSVVGVDLSIVMARLTRQRTGSSTLQANVSVLPFAAGSFDRLFSSYVLDLIPYRSLGGILTEFRRVLRPDGRLVVLALTEGVAGPSRAVVGMWKAVYKIAPIACGGCRPIRLSGLTKEAGFGHVHREIVVQFGVPSEIIVAEPALAGNGIQ
jgi:demethylmenaquinone methyltransferase/2-methoxy-6-polyprenyl-1,4-benzoquinol methylase